MKLSPSLPRCSIGLLYTIRWIFSTKKMPMACHLTCHRHWGYCDRVLLGILLGVAAPVGLGGIQVKNDCLVIFAVLPSNGELFSCFPLGHDATDDRNHNSILEDDRRFLLFLSFVMIRTNMVGRLGFTTQIQQ